MSQPSKLEYKGKWTEPKGRDIPLPFIAESLAWILRAAASDASEYTHHEIAQWCSNFVRAYADRDTEEPMTTLIRVAADVDCQWDLFLASTYKLKELQNLDFGKIKLPQAWFADWLKKIGNENCA